MRFYSHEINPHDSAEHHDVWKEGKAFGIWEEAIPAQSPHLYRLYANSKAEAKQLVKKANEEITKLGI